MAESAAPTFGGATLTGDKATVRVDVGELRVAASSFSFPGIDGVFERRLGVRERPIWWRGELRGDNDYLNFIEANIENELRDGQAKTMVDAYGRQHQGLRAQGLPENRTTRLRRNERRGGAGL